MNICLNGAPFELAQELSVSELLELLHYRPDRVAVERNGCVLARAAFDSTPVAAGDTVEIVCFVGGG